MLLAVEPLFLQDDGGDSVFNQRQTGVVRSRYESKNTHGLRAIRDGFGQMPMTCPIQRAMALQGSWKELMAQ